MFVKISLSLFLALSLLTIACGGSSNDNQTQDIVETTVTDVSGDSGNTHDITVSDKSETVVTTDLPAGETHQDIGVEVSTTVNDPAPNFNTPGSYTDGNSSPVTDITDYEINAGSATFYTFTGMITGADGNGRFYVAGPNDEKIDGTIPTTGDRGTFSVTIPLFCGVQIVKLVWENDTGSRIVVIKVTRTGCEGVDIQITLTWDALGRDWELHLIKPGGQINDNATDCTWTSCIGSSPDWGVVGDTTDNPHKDVDNTGAYGPENIYLSNPENGAYTVMVEHWNSGSSESKGQAILNVAGSLTIVPIINLAYMHVRTVATIAWPSGVVTPMNTDYDCSGNWSGGCKADIP